jgi:hypothetical protein
MGVLHEKNWPKKSPTFFLHEGKWGGGFVNISVNQIGHFEKFASPLERGDIFSSLNFCANKN